MLRRIYLLLTLLFTFTLASAQILRPAKLFAEPLEGTAKVGDVVDIVFKANIDKGWHIYTVGFDLECGPLPTVITFEDHPGFELVGELKAINDKTKYEESFGC